MSCLSRSSRNVSLPTSDVAMKSELAKFGFLCEKFSTELYRHRAKWQSQFDDQVGVENDVKPVADDKADVTGVSTQHLRIKDV